MVKSERQLREAVASLQKRGLAVEVTPLWTYTEEDHHSIVVRPFRGKKKRKIRRRRVIE